MDIRNFAGAFSPRVTPTFPLKGIPYYVSTGFHNGKFWKAELEKRRNFEVSAKKACPYAIPRRVSPSPCACHQKKARSNSQSI